MRAYELHVISFRTLREFGDQHGESRGPLKTWHKVASWSVWPDISAVRAVYPHADAVGKCTVFNIGGNDFRLVVQIDFETQVIYVKTVMTHAEYSRSGRAARGTASGSRETDRGQVVREFLKRNGALWKQACGC